MKKLVLFFIFILSLNCFSMNVPKNVDNKIRNWIKITYPVDSFGSSAQKMMYGEEIKNYIWLEDNVKSVEDKKIYKRTLKLYNPNEYGYSALKIMYDEEKKNSNW